MHINPVVGNENCLKLMGCLVRRNGSGTSANGILEKATSKDISLADHFYPDFCAILVGSPDA
jgi:hypothetical protein